MYVRISDRPADEAESPTFFGAKATAAAWSKKSSYAMVAQQGRMINPDLERFMTGRAKSETIELPGSHAIFLSYPKERSRQ
jgi:hypothetical protein